MNKESIKKIAQWLGNLLLTVVFVLCLAFLGLKAFGIQSNVVMSGSMEPTIPTGSVVFVDEKYGYDKLRINDIAVFQTGNTGSDGSSMKVIHRIIEKRPEGFVTKGDNNEASDGVTVTRDTFEGKEVFHIPYIGYGIKLMDQYHLNIIIIGLVFCYFLYQFVFTFLIRADEDEE